MTRLTLTARTRLNTYANVSRKQSDKETFDMSIPGVPDEFEELMPCPACPDGYVWNSNGPTRKLCPVCKGLAAVGYRAAQTEQTSGETPSASEQANASVPESRTGPLDHQSAAGTNCAAEDGARPSPESARGPAADPIADLCERLRYIGMFEDDRRDGISPMCREAADALERLARENAKWNELHRVVAGELDCDEETWPDHRNAPLAIGAMFILIKQRAERAEAERDALLAIVRAADAMYAIADHTGGNPGCDRCDAADDYLAARAAWKGEGQ